MHTTLRSIVIVGGGFAGTEFARTLDGRLPAGWELVLVSEESYTTFNPLLPEAVGASIFPEQAVAPIRMMLRRARFVMGRVTAIADAAAARMRHLDETSVYEVQTAGETPAPRPVENRPTEHQLPCVNVPPL